MSAPEYQAVERRPIRTTSAPSPTLAAAWCRSGRSRRGRRGRAPRRRRGRAPGSAGPGRASVAARRELRVDGQPRREDEPARLGRLAQPVEGRPRALRVDVVGGDRRDAAPVVDARVEQRRRSRRRGSAAPARGRRRGRTSRAQRDRPEVVLGRARRVVAHRRARLGQEVLDDHLLHVAVAARGWRRSPRAPSSRSASVSPMPTRMPVVNGIASSPAASSVASRRSGVLSGAPRWRGEVGVEGLDHHPLATALTGRSRASSSRGERAGVGVRQQPGLVEHQAAHRRQVVDRRGVAVLGAASRARRRTASSGRLAEGEQRLVAAGLGALRRRSPSTSSGDEVRRGEVLRAAGRTCSSRSGRGTAASAG